MSRTMIIIDVNYLAYRSFHVFGKLAYRNSPTGVTYGVLKEIQTLKELFQTEDLIFCFDHGKNIRKNFYEGYKRKRDEKKKQPDMKNQIRSVRREVKKLKYEILPELGYKNIFYLDGYEADDMIAISCWNKHRNIIVSADQDLYQLLSKNTSIWNPNKKEMITDELFHSNYGIPPIAWIKVKSLAGCSTDEIPGCEGVGEKKAIQFFTGEMNKETPTYQKCKEFVKTEDYKRNLQLVALPFSQLKTTRGMCVFQENNATSKKWNRVVRKLGMKSFLNKQPNWNTK